MSLVELKKITKTFGSVKALDDVSFRAKAGTIQALVGENGAGKTTLMKALYGELQPTAGEILLDGAPIGLRRAADAKTYGIGMVSQHYAIIPELSCLENLVLGAETGEWLSLDAAQVRAEALATRMGFKFNWRKPASGLSPGDSQKLEILKLLWRDSKIMILDEPTAMLSPSDADALYRSLSALAKEGACIIVVTHRSREVIQYCSGVTVLRGGKLIDARPVANLSEDELAELIIGRAVTTSTKSDAVPGKPVVEAKGLRAKGSRGNEAVNVDSLTVASGEVVGIAGVDGSGQKELFDVLMGRLRQSGGTLHLMGEPAPAATSDRLALGVRVIPEDRLHQAVASAKSLVWNALLGFQRMAFLRNGPWVKRDKQKEFAQASLEKFNAKFRNISQPLGDLSGGNQQRFVVGRALGHEPQIVLAFQPTRGLDIEGTAQIFNEIREVCRTKGAGALVVSFDLQELIDHTDRVVVMFDGRISEPPPHLSKDFAAIGRLMVGLEA